MGDVLAAIREKSQAHQEESRAKRLRDRGGLWQPLSPSKNQLMTFLNSADFHDIEEPQPVEQEADLMQAPVIPQISIGKGKGKARFPLLSKGKGRAASSGIGDNPAESVKNELEIVSAPPKKRNKRNVHATIKSTGRKKAADPEPRCTESSSDSNMSRSLPTEQKQKVPRVISTEKQKLATIDEERGPSVVAEMIVEKPQSAATHVNDHVTPPRRSKRPTRKRRQPDHSDEEDGVSDHRLYPAKKPRTRAVSKAKILKPTKIRNVKSTSPLSPVRQAITQDNNSTEYEETSNLKGMNIHPVAQDTLPKIASTMRGRKWLHMKSDIDEPSESPAKRKRTRSSLLSKENSKSTKSSRADQLEYDMTSEDESLKPRKRRMPTSEASTMFKCHAKCRGRKCLEKPLRDSQKATVLSRSDENVGSRDDPQPSTVPEMAGGRLGHRVAKGPLKGPSKGPSPVAGTEVIAQNLGMTKRRRKKVKTEANDIDVQGQGADQTLKTSKRHSGKRAVSPCLVISGSKSHQVTRWGLDEHSPLALDAQKSKAHRNAQSKSKTKSKSRPPADQDISLVTLAKKSKIQSKERKVNEACHGDEHSTVHLPNKPSPARELLVQPATDSDFDELDLLS